MENIIFIINSWQFNLVGALIFSVLFTQFYKLAVKGITNDGVATIIIQIIAGLSILIFVPFFLFIFPDSLYFYGLLFLAAVFYALNDRIQTTVRRELDVSVFAILNQISKVFLIIYGIILFQEGVTLNKLLGGALILLGNIILFYKKGRLKLNKYVMLSVLASFLMATALIVDVEISKQFNLPFYIMLTLIIPALFIFIAEKHSVGQLIEEFGTIRKKYYLITGFSWGIMILFFIRSLQSTEVIFMAPLLATSVLLNVIVASIMHKEKENLIKKSLAAIVVILGVAVLVS